MFSGELDCLIDGRGSVAKAKNKGKQRMAGAKNEVTKMATSSFANDAFTHSMAFRLALPNGFSGAILEGT